MMTNRACTGNYKKFLEDLVPHAPISQYRHNDTGEDNADAHIKRQVMGREVVVVLSNGDLGTWEKIFYGEFDSRAQPGTVPGREPVRRAPLWAGEPNCAAIYRSIVSR